MTYRQIGDHRFEGLDNGALSDLVQKFSSGEAARAFGNASHALRQLSAALADTDDVLRRELGKLRIDWQGLAGESGHEDVTKQAEFAVEADESGKRNAQATMMQSESQSVARNNMPPADKLNGATSTGVLDDAAGFFGYETDRAKEVKETNAARQQAIDSLNGYVSNSRDAMNNFRDPGQPPSYEVTQTSSVSTPVGHTQQPTVGTPGIPGTPGTPGVPGVTPGTGGNPVNPTPNLPGGTTGTMPGTQPGVIPPGPGLPGKAGSPLPVGLGIAAAATAGLGAAAATARPGQTVGGGRGPSQAPKTPIAGMGPKGAPATIGAGGPGGTSGTTKGGAAGVGPVDEDGPHNRPGAKGGAAAGKGGSGLMSPAAGAAKGEGDEDEEHVRKYGVDSDDVFGDERMVVQSVIGEDPKDK